MNESNQLGEAVLRFVNLLTPGNFASAEKWLSPECEYSYGGTILRGPAIIESFKSNHESAAKKLDRIEYQDGKVERIDDRSVSVLVIDRIWVKDRTHDYMDRLIVTFDVDPGPGSVIRIENRRVDGERDKLLRFFESCGIHWE